MAEDSHILDGRNFRLYQDLYDRETGIFLELTGPAARFEASERRIQVRIPMEIFGVLRRVSFPDLSLVKASDREIQARVDADIRERIKARRQGRGLSSGWVVYGLPKDSEEQQHRRGLRFYRKRRREQRRVAAETRRLVGSVARFYRQHSKRMERPAPAGPGKKTTANP